MPETHGLAVAASRLTRKVAPTNAPTNPGTARMPTVRQSTLPSLWWEKPETSEVPISEKWTAADAAAGATPAASSSVEEVTPYAMPREPSMSWARRPTNPRTRSLRMRKCPFGRAGRAYDPIRVDLVSLI